MTTQDPAPGEGSALDDATSAYDAQASQAAQAAQAAQAEGAGAPAAPWPEPAATWPPAGAPAWPPAGTASGAPPAGSAPPPVGTVPSAGAGPTGWGSPPGSAGTRGPAPIAGPGTPPGLVAGAVLVVIGAVLLLSRVVDISLAGVTWPLWIVVPGVAMLVGSFFIAPRGGVGLAIPGAIVTIVGLILWVQEAYGLYATWAYAWALVAPTGPGLGMLLYGLVHRDGELVGDGFRTMLVGIGLFLGFALFFEGVIGLSGEPIPNLDQILPYGVIALGILLVALSFVGGARRPREPRPR